MGGSDADKYTAFFPIDGLPHFALLDPRSAERLIVWGNADGDGLEHGNISDTLWQEVQEDLVHFKENHSLTDDALGPLHREEKTWAVRTRRVSNTHSAPVLQPTSLMDDEHVAIAAAIAASLAEPTPQNERTNEHSNEDTDYGQMYTDTDSSHSHDDVNQPETDSESDFVNTQSTDDEDDKQSDQSHQSHQSHQSDQSHQSTARSLSDSVSTPPTPLPPPPERPMLVPSRGDLLPSSVESLPSSYLGRVQSCLRSSTDPTLNQTRQLVQEQDAELAAALMEDRQREENERNEVRQELAHKEAVMAATTRLPPQPSPDDVAALTIAIRLSSGKRLERRFNNFDMLASVADFVVSETHCVGVMDKEPAAALRSFGMNIHPLTWQTPLSGMVLGRRTVFTLTT